MVHRFGLHGCEIFVPWNIQLQRVPIPTTLSGPPAYASMIIKSHTFQYESRLTVKSSQCAMSFWSIEMSCYLSPFPDFAFIFQNRSYTRSHKCNTVQIANWCFRASFHLRALNVTAVDKFYLCIFAEGFFYAHVFAFLTHRAQLGPRKMLCFQKHGHFIPSLNLTGCAWPSVKTWRWCKHKHKRLEANSTCVTFLHNIKKEREKFGYSKTSLSEEHSTGGGYLYKTFTGTCPEPVKVCDNIPFI